MQFIYHIHIYQPFLHSTQNSPSRISFLGPLLIKPALSSLYPTLRKKKFTNPPIKLPNLTFIYIFDKSSSAPSTHPIGYNFPLPTRHYTLSVPSPFWHKILSNLTPNPPKSSISSNLKQIICSKSFSLPVTCKPILL